MITIQNLFDPSNYFFNIYAVFSFVTALVVISFGFWILYHNPKGEKNRAFFGVTFFPFIWQIFEAITYSSRNPDIAFFWYKNFAYTGVFYISAAVFFFSTVWSEKIYRKSKKIVYFFYGFLTVLALINIFDEHSVFSGVRWHFYGYYVVFTPLGIVFLGLWFIPLIWAFYNLYESFKEAESSLVKNQIKLLNIGLLIAYLGVVDYLPAIIHQEIYTGVGYTTIIILVFMWGYTIIHYRVMEIETVIHKTILWIISSVVIVIPLFFIIYFSFGYLKNLTAGIVALISLVLFYVFRWYNDTLQPRINHFFRRRSYDYYENLVSVIEEISTSLDLEEVLYNLSDSIFKAFYPQYSNIYLNTENGFVSHSGNLENVIIPYGTSLYNFFDESKKAVDINELESLSNPNLKQEILTLAKNNNIVLFIPFVLKGKVIGLLALGKKSNLNPYTMKDMELLEQLGIQASIPLYNAVHHEELDKAVMLREQKLKEQLRTILADKSRPLDDKLDEFDRL